MLKYLFKALNNCHTLFQKFGWAPTILSFELSNVMKYLPEFLLCEVKCQCHFLWDIFILLSLMSITSPSLYSSGYKSRLFAMVVRTTFPRSAISEFIYIQFDFHFQHYHLGFISLFYGCIFTLAGHFYFWIIQLCNISDGFITGSKNATKMHALVSVCENSIINNVREIRSMNATVTFAKIQYLQVV